MHWTSAIHFGLSLSIQIWEMRGQGERYWLLLKHTNVPFPQLFKPEQDLGACPQVLCARYTMILV